MPEIRHGTSYSYRRGCKCEECLAAHAAANRRGNRKQQAKWLAQGRRATDGKPRSQPYDERGLALMREFGFEPDPRFVWSAPDA